MRAAAAEHARDRRAAAARATQQTAAAGEAAAAAVVAVAGISRRWWPWPARNTAVAWRRWPWPAVATGYRYAAVVTRMTRSAMLEVLREDYVRTARAKGLFEKVIVNQHALKNALLPVITLVGIEFAFLIGGLVVTEQVFNLNGLGKLFVDAVLNHDYTLAQSMVMMVVTVFVVVNLIVDLIYAWVDPRIRYS